jgi:hypothetical protein
MRDGSSSVRQPTPSADVGTSCGPDVTAWFVNLMNTAKRDRRVLAIKQRLEGARTLGAGYGYNSMEVAEGALVRMVLQAARSAGNPARTPAADAQIGAADPGNQFGRMVLIASIPLPFVGAPEHFMVAAIRSASLSWKSLFETGAVFDFKNTTVLNRNSLAAAGCPALCPGDPPITIAGRCYENDLPGNIFYAYLSGFVGFSLTATHLGSQFAELQPNSSSGWDSAEDTAALNLGFNLPQGTLTQADLVSRLQSPTAGVRVRNCTPCPVVYNPSVALQL